MSGLLAHGGPGGFVLELGVVVVPLVLLAWFARWNRRHPHDEAESPKGDSASG